MFFWAACRIYAEFLQCEYTKGCAKALFFWKTFFGKKYFFQVGVNRHRIQDYISTWFIYRYDLFAEVKDMKYSANNSEVLVTLTKKKPAKWKALLLNGAKKETVKLDFSRAIDSDDETDSEDDSVVLPPPPQPLPRGQNVSLASTSETKSGYFLLLASIWSAPPLNSNDCFEAGEIVWNLF